MRSVPFRLFATSALVLLAAHDADAKKAPVAIGPIAASAAGPRVREIESAGAKVRDGDLDLRFGAESGLLRHAYRRTPPGAVRKATTARSAADRFLADHAVDLGLDAGPEGARITLFREMQSPSGAHFRWNQTVEGVPVYRSDIVVKIANDGTFSSLHSNLRLGVNVPVQAAVASSAALEAARGTVQPTGKSLGEFTAALHVVEYESGPALTWIVTMPVEEPMGDWRVFVDAHDGTVRGVEDHMAYVDGSGRVFDPDPRTKMNNPALVDNADSDAAVPFPASYDDRALLGITQTGPTYSLSGPYVQLLDFESPAGAPVTTNDPNGFFFQRSAQGFEDVMCYFHLDQSQRYIQSLGFNNVNNRVQPVDPHGLNGADNSHYVPATGRLAFGEGGVDDDEDADVILHEYGHAIQDNIVPGWGGGQEGAMGEGFGDYWAGSYSVAVNPTFQPSFVFTWDGHNQFWPGRVLVDSTLHYPENCCGQVHASGTLWCSGLTDCMRRVGRQVMDTIVLDHHFALGTTATMAEAAEQVIQSDLDLYGGAHLATLVGTFGFWGFVDPADYIPAIAHAPLGDTNDTTGPYPVVATVVSAQALASVRLHWGVGAFTDSIPMTATGNPGEYGAAIPGPLTGVPVRYFIRARDVNGGTGVQPAGAPAAYYTFHVGPNNGAIRGRAQLVGQSDHSGITVSLAPGGASQVTGATGEFEFNGLYVDSYQITATKASYVPAVRGGVAVALATTTETTDLQLFEQLTAQMCASPNAVIPEGAFPGANVLNVAQAFTVQGVEVDVHITHPNIGDLTLELQHGTKVVQLHNQGGGTADNIIGTYPTTLTPSGPGSLSDFLGDPSNGAWTLRYRDLLFNGSGGRVVSWCIRLLGPTQIPSAAEDERATAAILLRSEPNPARGGVADFRFALPKSGRASLTVFDVAGRRVRTVLDRMLTAGRHETRWDGRDDHGAPVPAGVYVYRLDSGETRLARKLVVVR